MSDEEYGRAWAAVMGKAPVRGIEYPAVWFWRPTRRPEDAADPAIPRQVLAELAPNNGGRMYCTEADAYAALGRAVRSIHAAVPRLPDQH